MLILSKIVCKTEKVTQEVSHLFFSPSISSLVGWYIEIPSVKEFTYSICVDRIIHCTLLFQFLQNITELYIVCNTNIGRVNKQAQQSYWKNLKKASFGESKPSFSRDFFVYLGLQSFICGVARLKSKLFGKYYRMSLLAFLIIFEYCRINS